MALNKSLRNVSRRIRFRVISANQRSIWLGQENWSGRDRRYHASPRERLVRSRLCARPRADALICTRDAARRHEQGMAPATLAGFKGLYPVLKQNADSGSDAAIQTAMEEVGERGHS